MENESERVLPRGMLRRNYRKGGRGGSYYMRLRIIPNKNQVAKAVDLGLSTRDFAEAQQRAINILNALDILGWEYCCKVGTDTRQCIAYDDIRTWKRQVREAVHLQAEITPSDAPCQPTLPGLESFCDHE